MFIYLKRLISSKFVRVKAFPMYGGIGVSAPSLHRESTDSLIPFWHNRLFIQGHLLHACMGHQTQLTQSSGLQQKCATIYTILYNNA